MYCNSPHAYVRTFMHCSVIRPSMHNPCMLVPVGVLLSVARQRTRASSGGQTKHQRAHKGNILVSLQVSEHSYSAALL